MFGFHDYWHNVHYSEHFFHAVLSQKPWEEAAKPFHRCGNRSSQRCKDLPQFTQLLSERGEQNPTFKPSLYSPQLLLHCFKAEVTIFLCLKDSLGPEIGFPGCGPQCLSFEIGSHWNSLLGNQAAEVGRPKEKAKTVHWPGLIAHPLNYSDRITKKKSTERFHFTVNGFELALIQRQMEAALVLCLSNIPCCFWRIIGWLYFSMLAWI